MPSSLYYDTTLLQFLYKFFLYCRMTDPLHILSKSLSDSDGNNDDAPNLNRSKSPFDIGKLQKSFSQQTIFITTFTETFHEDTESQKVIIAAFNKLIRQVGLLQISQKGINLMIVDKWLINFTDSLDARQKYIKQAMELTLKEDFELIKLNYLTLNEEYRKSQENINKQRVKSRRYKKERNALRLDINQLQTDFQDRIRESQRIIKHLNYQNEKLENKVFKLQRQLKSMDTISSLQYLKQVGERELKRQLDIKRRTSIEERMQRPISREILPIDPSPPTGTVFNANISQDYLSNLFWQDQVQFFNEIHPQQQQANGLS